MFQLPFGKWAVMGSNEPEGKREKGGGMARPYIPILELYTSFLFTSVGKNLDLSVPLGNTSSHPSPTH